MEKSYLELFLEHKDSLAALTADNVFYDAMENCVDGGESKYSLFNRYFDKKIDLRWVEEIEACIIPLDNIMRVPRKFIVQEEEIVPIERARKITNESIRHLAQHTNMIAKVEGDDVTPNQILNVFREESFEVYENRFVYTLMQNLIRFIDVRYNVLFNISDDDNMASLKMESNFSRGREKITYKLEIAAQSGGGELDSASGLEGENATAFQRIERIKRIINEYAHSAFMKELQNCVPVRPPIMRTNAIQKNPNFRACLKLWQFIQSYSELGYEIIVKESNDMVSDEYRSQLNKMMSINYMMLKANTLSEDAVGKQKRRKLKPKLLKRLAEELVLDYDMEDVEIQKVFVEEIKRVSKRKMEAEKKIQDAIDRALAAENARKKAIEDKIKAKIAHEKEMERRRIAREREKEKLAKQREKERLAREKAKEKERIAREKEKERIAKEKEKARIAKEKERQAKLKALEDARIAKQKQLEKERKEKELARKQAQLEKEKAARARAREKERQAKLLAAQKEKERAAAARQKERERAAAAKQKEKEALAKARAQRAEKERAAREKARAIEKERIAREKAQQAERDRKAKEKAAQLEKERIAREKEKEKARIAKEKEKEQLARERAKEKERIARENAKEKERIAREKAKEKEKEQLARLRAQQAEKERIAREKAKEKERIARERIREQEKAEREKAREKERIAREKAREKAKEQERAAREKAKEKERALREKTKKQTAPAPDKPEEP